MNDQEKQNLLMKIRDADQKIQAARREIEQAKRAGLHDLVADHETEVAQLEQFIQKVKSVYGA